jgi:hypothetical protein
MKASRQLHTPADLPKGKPRLSTFSSSSSYALQLWKGFGLLNDDLPFGAILDMFWQLNNLHPSHVIPDDIFPSGLGSSCWSSCVWFPFIYFLYNTGFRHSIYVSKPT